MVLWSLGWSTNFQTPISVKPLNSSCDVAHYFSPSSEFNASWYELGASWNMCIKILLILSLEGCGRWANCSLVGQKEYCGLGGSGIAGPWPDLEGCAPVGTTGAMGGFRRVCDWGCFTVCLDADWPGLGGHVGGWAGMTRSSPEWSDSLLDSEIGWLLDGTRFDFFNIISFTWNRVSSNFTSQEISKCWWAVSQNWYPLDPGS